MWWNVYLDVMSSNRKESEHVNSKTKERKYQQAALQTRGQ